MISSKANGTGGLLLVSIVASVLLVSITWMSYLAPTMGLGIVTIRITCTLITAATAAVLLLKHSRYKRTVRFIQNEWIAFVAPLIGALSLGVAAYRASWTPLWVMSGDMVWNTVQSLLIFEDGGLASQKHTNPAPLTNEIFALFYSENAPLVSVFRAHAIVVIILICSISLISGLYASKRLSHLKGIVRFPLVFAVSWLPFTSLLLEPVARLGHANSMASLLLLWLCWVVYAEQSLPWTSKVALLGLIATAILASWAPLVIVPVALGVLAIWDGLRFGISLRQVPGLIPATLSLLQFVVYGAVVTLPDFLRESEALGADGAAVPLHQWAALLLWMVVTLLALVTFQRSKDSRQDRAEATAALLLLTVTTTALGYLVFQRIEQGSPAWGYYPIKLVSLALLLLLGVSVVMIGRLIPREAPSSHQLVRAAFGLPLYLFAILVFSNWTLNANTLAPSIALMKADAPAEQALAIQQLESVAANDTSDSISLFFKWGALDDLADAYLLQMEADQATDSIRWFAYFFDRSKPSEWCKFAAETTGQIRVFTHLDREAFLSKYFANCSGNINRVEVLNEVPPAR